MPCLCIVLMSLVSLFPHIVCVCVCAHQYLGVLTALEAGWILLGFPGELRKQMDEVSRLYIDTKGAETDHGHWENTLHRNRESTLTRSMHGDLSAYCFCFTVKKRTVFYVESPAFGYSLRTPDRIFICDKVIDKS